MPKPEANLSIHQDIAPIELTLCNYLYLQETNIEKVVDAFVRYITTGQLKVITGLSMWLVHLGV